MVNMAGLSPLCFCSETGLPAFERPWGPYMKPISVEGKRTTAELFMSVSDSLVNRLRKAVSSKLLLFSFSWKGVAKEIKSRNAELLNSPPRLTTRLLPRLATRYDK